ncbi:MAG: autotransporter outer membrane beta-barrel domain-containing protein [Planctomycetaceae bacterium]|jgi:hypothetical protein|nr:autotransporter outer membrane beta-barrel domain-containing protein [Planctomycetaceae bacterium]
MSRIFTFFAVFALFSVLTAEKVSATSLESDDGKENTSLFPDRPVFSTDVDTFLGQSRRRRGGGGGGRVWSNLYYGDTTLKPKESEKTNPRFYGLQLGFDVAKSHGIYSTFFLHVNQSKTKFAGNSSSIDNYLLGYGKFIYLSMCHFTFTGSLGYDRYEVSNGKAAQGDGLQTNFFGEFGLDFLFGKWGIKPFYALQYDFLYHGNIGHSPVLVNDWNGHGLNQLFGLRLSWKMTDSLEWQCRSVWVHEMLDNPPPFYHARFSPVHGTNTPAIMFYGGNTGRDWAWLGIGGKFEGVYNVYLFFDYDAILNERHVTHLGSIGLCLGW